MLPTFAYIMAFMLYAATSACILVFALGCLVFPKSRRMGKKIGAGVFCSLPSMILFQIVGFPFTFLVILVAGVAFAIFKFNEALSYCIGIPLLFCSILIFAVASGYGIYFGYRAGWMIVSGTSLMEVCQSDKVIAFFLFLWNKTKKRPTKSSNQPR